MTYRRYHKINIDTLRNDLSNCSFVACPGDTAKKLYDQYTNDLSNLLDKHAPEVTRCLAKEPAKWLSDTYKNAKSIRQQFKHIWRKKKTPLNRARLRKQIARCNSLANKDKATYYRALVNENGDNPKKLWQVLRSTLHHIPDKVLPSNSSHKKLAYQFAAFFTNKIAKIRESLSSSSSFSLPSPVNPPGLVKFDDASPDDIAKVIKNSPTKSCLLDPWPTFLVKDCLDILLPSITKLVNCSLSEGAVPDGFKSAVVTPLIKKSSLSKDDLKNYRPVSGLSFISKLVERVVASQLSRHVSLHGLENENQSAYRRGHSTETALLSIKNQIHLSLARGEATAVVLLDQSAAFDTIDHEPWGHLINK